MGNEVVVKQVLKFHSAISSHRNTYKIIYKLFKHFHKRLSNILLCYFSSINVQIIFERTKRHYIIVFHFIFLGTYRNNRMGTILRILLFYTVIQVLF